MAFVNDLIASLHKFGKLERGVQPLRPRAEDGDLVWARWKTWQADAAHADTENAARLRTLRWGVKTLEALKIKHPDVEELDVRLRKLTAFAEEHGYDVGSSD